MSKPAVSALDAEVWNSFVEGTFSENHARDYIGDCLFEAFSDEFSTPFGFERANVDEHHWFNGDPAPTECRDCGSELGRITSGTVRCVECDHHWFGAPTGDVDYREFRDLKVEQIARNIRLVDTLRPQSNYPNITPFNKLLIEFDSLTHYEADRIQRKLIDDTFDDVPDALQDEYNDLVERLDESA